MGAFGENIKGKQDSALRGKNAARINVAHKALFVARPPAVVMANNAPASNGVNRLSVKTISPIAAAYVHALARNKLQSDNGTGASSWVGKQFGG